MRRPAARLRRVHRGKLLDRRFIIAFVDLLCSGKARRARLRLPRHNAPRVPLAKVRPGAGSGVRRVRRNGQVKGQEAQLRARGGSYAFGAPQGQAFPLSPTAAPAEARASASSSE